MRGKRRNLNAITIAAHYFVSDPEGCPSSLNLHILYSILKLFAITRKDIIVHPKASVYTVPFALSCLQYVYRTVKPYLFSITALLLHPGYWLPIRQPSTYQPYIYQPSTYQPYIYQLYCIPINSLHVNHLPINHISTNCTVQYS